MTPLVLTAIVSVTLWVAAQPVAQQTLPTFYATTDAIMVPVAVHNGGRPVRGLVATDFVVLDNGVPQSIELVRLDAVPIDVTVVLDASGSLSDMARIQLRRDVEELARLLEPGDRLGALSFDSTVTELAALQPADQMVLGPSVDTFGTTAFFNALVGALLLESDPARPHLIVALTDGADNVSFLAPEDVLSVAERSNAVLTVLVRDQAPGTFQGWSPFSPAGLTKVLERAAETTGGTTARERVTRSAARLFERVINEFKTGYLLWFKPDEDGAPGWHTIDVTVPTAPTFRIRARRGYVAGG